MSKRTCKAQFYALTAVRRGLCLLALAVAPATTATPTAQIAPLVENLRELHCAMDAPAAEHALQRLKQNRNPLTGLPDEYEGTRERQASTHAGSIDLAISTVIDTINSYPALTPLAESILFSWNYCQVFNNGTYYDLNGERSKVTSNATSYLSPSQWQGFSRLGLGYSNAPRYQPQAFSTTAGTVRNKLLYDWWNLQRNQCLPHPANGQIFHRKQYVARGKVNTDDSIATDHYPLTWNGNCTVPFTVAEIQLDLQRKADVLNRLRLTHARLEWQANQLILQQRRLADIASFAIEKANTPIASLHDLLRHDYAVPPVKLFSHVSAPETPKITLAQRETETHTPLPPPVPDLPAPLPIRPRPAPAKQVTLTATETIKNESDLAMRYEWYKHQLRNADAAHTAEILDKLQPPASPPQTAKVTETPVLAAAIPTTPKTSYQDGSVPPFQTPAAEDPATPTKRKYHGLSGSFALTNRKFEGDNWTFTANLNYKPIIDSYFFARTGFTWVDDEEPLSYYWGIGYNDWHPGTWAFELNNWGPLKPGDGLMLEKAIASISYKFDSAFLKKHNFSTSATVSGGENSSPALTVAGTWAPKPNWFIRNLITQPLEGGEATWAYGFGYNDYRAKTWSLEYNNWGPNTLSSPNFRDNALVTLSWKWNL
ncbi:MAG: hypothetical protein AAF404_07610 [Pseudomonadota bacterium]